MSTILLLTVGGSHQPIVTSITQQQPAFVYFLCSDDSGKLKGSYQQVVGDGNVLKSKHDLDKPDLPNIVALTGLRQDQFEIHKIDRFDDLNTCYLESAALIEKARKAYPTGRILVDYTGGTKSMTAGLAAAALDDGLCDIYLVAGHRRDLVKVQDQTEFVRPVHVWDAQAMRRLRAARELLDRYDYAAAEQLLRDAAARFAGEQTMKTLQRGIALCKAFDAWDKFQHPTTRGLLEPYKGEFVPHWRFLNGLLGQGETHGFEWIEDLLRNAQRRAAQGRFDDAVGRFYRAVELTAQIWLKERRQLDTGNIELEKSPEAVHIQVAKCRDNGNADKTKIKIGLLLAWDVVAAFPDDPLGAIFKPFRSRLLNFLAVRNDSLFAHGFRPIAAADYNQHAPVLTQFMSDCVAAGVRELARKRAVILEQLPTMFLDTLT